MLSRFMKLNNLHLTSSTSNITKYKITNFIRKFSKDIDTNEKDKQTSASLDEKIQLKERFTVRSITPDPKSYLRTLSEQADKIKEDELNEYYNSDEYKKNKKRQDFYKKVNRFFVALLLLNVSISMFETYTKYPESDLDVFNFLNVSII